MAMPRRFVQVDVFAERTGYGNPLAVVLDSAGVDDAAMQAFANWTNLSETTFLLPPTEPGASYRVRIFTPGRELPFAGHPSVGSAHAALDAGLCRAHEGRLVQQCGAGLLPLLVRDEAGARTIHVRAPRAEILPAAAFGAALDAALPGVARGRLPAALIDNGPVWWVVELADEDAVRRMQPDFESITCLTTGSAAVGLAVFAASADGAEHQLVVRAFCPGDGIPEDPVTGSANAAIACWLDANQALPARRYLASQGREVGRDGRVYVEVDAEGWAWIGGQTQTVIEGTLSW